MMLGIVHICQQLGGGGGGGGGKKKQKKTDLKIRKEGGSRSLNYVSTCQSLIFRYCHNLDAKHVTTLNRGGKGGWGCGYS